MSPSSSAGQAFDNATRTGMEARRARIYLPPEPPPEPPAGMPALPPASSLVLPPWAGLVLAATGLIAQQTAVGLGRLPPSAPIAVALVVLGIVSASAAALQTLFAQYSAHSLTMVRLKEAP